MADDFVPLNDLGRSRFLPELQDPRIRDRLLGYTQAEVGGQGPQAQQAFMETIFNRATARRLPLREVLSGSYFPDVTHARAARGVGEGTRSAYDPILSSVLGGSNLSNYATGNASGNVGFAGGPQTAAYGGERYGVEGPDRGWWTQMGAEGPANYQAVGYTGQGRRSPVERAPAPQGLFGRLAAALPDTNGLSGPLSAFTPLDQLGVRGPRTART